MELFPLEKFPHVQLLKESKLNVLELSEDLQVSIAGFVRRYNGYKLKGSEEALKTLKSDSNILFQHIYDYYIDKDEQTVEVKPNEEISKSEIKEVAEEIKEEIKEEKTPESTPAPEIKPEVVESIPGAPQGQQQVTTEAPKVEEVIPTNKNEKALYELFKAGIKEDITISKLKEAGFDTGGWGPLGIKGTNWIGKYRLTKEVSEKTYKLIVKE